MGVDSGLPDFRGQTGFWKAYPPLGKLGLNFEQMANAALFERDPRTDLGVLQPPTVSLPADATSRGFCPRRWARSIST
jgi:hypothetical protein